MEKCFEDNPKGGFAGFLNHQLYYSHWILHLSTSQKIPPPHVAWVPSGAIEVVDLAWKHPLGNGKFSEKLLQEVNRSNF